MKFVFQNRRKGDDHKRNRLEKNNFGIFWMIRQFGKSLFYDSRIIQKDSHSSVSLDSRLGFLGYINFYEQVTVTT